MVNPRVVRTSFCGRLITTHPCANCDLKHALYYPTKVEGLVDGDAREWSPIFSSLSSFSSFSSSVCSRVNPLLLPYRREFCLSMPVHARTYARSDRRTLGNLSRPIYADRRGDPRRPETIARSRWLLPSSLTISFPSFSLSRVNLNRGGDPFLLSRARALSTFRERTIVFRHVVDRLSEVNR